MPIGSQYISSRTRVISPTACTITPMSTETSDNQRRLTWYVIFIHNFFYHHISLSNNKYRISYLGSCCESVNLWTWWHDVNLHQTCSISINRPVDDHCQVSAALNKLVFCQDNFRHFKNSTILSNTTYLQNKLLCLYVFLQCLLSILLKCFTWWYNTRSGNLAVLAWIFWVGHAGCVT